MRSLLPLLAVCCSLFLFSCQKEIDLKPTTPTTPAGSGGTTNNDSYFPLTSGSWWKVKDSTSGGLSTGSATNITRSINGIMYTAIIAASATQKDTAWYASPRPNYYITSKGVSPSGAFYDVTFHYLNDTASVGYSWQYDGGNGNGFKAMFKGIILQKGMTMTVAGKNYTDIIHTQLTLTYDVLGMLMDFGTYDFYTAKGVGVVKLRSNLGNPAFSFSFLACADLIDYIIK